MLTLFLLRKPVWRGAMLGALCGLAAWLLACSPIARGLENWALDGCFAYRGERPSQAKKKLSLSAWTMTRWTTCASRWFTSAPNWLNSSVSSSDKARRRLGWISSYPKV
jgi:hypothetical protein